MHTLGWLSDRSDQHRAAALSLSDFSDGNTVMPDNTPPLVFVDLIEDAPKSKSAFAAEDYSGEDVYHLDEHYQQYLTTKYQPWRVLIKSGDNQKPLFRSTERYFKKADAIHAIELAFGAGSDVYLRVAEQGKQVLRMADSNPEL